MLKAIGKAVGDVAGSVLGGVGDSPLGEFIPGFGDAQAAEKANKTNIKLAEQNRDWMERMSNTAYQRAMTDMKQAGLNPMLAYQQGGASVPTSNAPVVDPASKTGLATTALAAYSGINAAQTQKQNANTAQAQAESSIGLQGAQTAQTVAQAEATRAQTAKTIDSIKNQQVRRELEKAQIPLQKVKESAAELAKKGTERVDKVFDNLLRNTAKPKVNPKTLQYEGGFWKNLLKSDDGPLIKGK